MIKKFKSQRGQTIVEFAFILPLLVLIVIGIIDFSILFYDKAVITNASREGARQGSIFRSNGTSGAYEPLPVGDNASGITKAVNDYLAGRAVTFGGPTINTQVRWSTTSPPGSWGAWNGSVPAAPGGTIDVRVTYTYSFLAFPRLAGWPGTANITAETIMRME
jgi:Flp pilus assembly protein TadG